MRRRSDGLYRRSGRTHFFFKYKTAEGGWVEQATGTQDYNEARRVRSKFLSELQQGMLPNDRAKWTLAEAVEQWLSERQPRLSNGSFASEKTVTKSLLRVLGEQTRLDKLADIERVRAYENCRLREGISAKTVNNETIVLGGILRGAKLWHRVEPDYKRLYVKESDIGTAFAQEEGQRLLQVASASGEDSVAPFAAVLSYATGMRSGEIKRLKLESININSERPQLQVKRATTKTNRGCRFVALDKMAIWALGKLLSRAQRLGSTHPEHCLLPTRLDRHTRATDPLRGVHVDSGWDVTHNQTSWEKEWRSFRKLARIEKRRFHDLRHSYITRAAEAGVPILVVQAQVGHMSAAMVDHYCHISHTAVHRAAELMERQNPELLMHLGIATGSQAGAA